MELHEDDSFSMIYVPQQDDHEQYQTCLSVSVCESETNFS